MLCFRTNRLHAMPVTVEKEVFFLQPAMEQTTTLMKFFILLPLSVEEYRLQKALDRDKRKFVEVQPSHTDCLHLACFPLAETLRKDRCPRNTLQNW